MYNIYTFSYHLPHYHKKLPFLPTTFSARNIQTYTSLANFTGLYIYRILQRFPTKLCSFTNFKMSYPAVVNDLICFSCPDQILVFCANCRLTAGSNKPVELNSPAKCGDGQSFGFFIREFPQW